MGRKEVTIGYQYYMGIHMVLCHGPIDSLLRIDAGEREAWSGSVTSSQQIYVNNPDLFGGAKKEGGVQGYVDIMFGEDSQAVNSYLSDKIGTPMSAFRGVVSAVLRHCYVSSMTPYIKPWAFLLTRAPATGWYDTRQTIGDDDANPAHILYELFTQDPDQKGIGLNIPSGMLNLTQFQAVADTLYNEGFGLSFLWNSAESTEGLIQIVLDHIGAVCGQNPLTGDIDLRLVRNDYTVGSLPVFGEEEGNILELNDYQRRSLSETVNEITVTYTDPDTFQDTNITVQDLANIQAQGVVVPRSTSFPGIRNHDLASRVAQRELISSSALLATVKFTVKRDAWDLQPGDVFVFKWPPLGIVQLVCRVGEMDKGTIESGAITVSAVEDVFGLPSSVYTGVEPVGWTDPSGLPSACPRERVVEATYWDVYHLTDPANLAILDDNMGLLQTLGEQPSGDATAYEIHTRGASYEDSGTGDFTPVGLLSADLSVTDTLITLSYEHHLATVTDNSYAYIDDEIVKIIGISGMDVTVSRGVLDTVPAAHSAGAVIWFAGMFSSFSNLEYTDAETVYAKLLPSTSRGTLSIGSATERSTVMAHRMIRPYPPGHFRVGSQYYPEFQVGSIPINWQHRDRLQQVAYIVVQTESSIGPEAGTTYHVIFRGETGSIIRQDNTLTGVTYSYLLATELSDSNLLMPASNEVWSSYSPAAQYRQNTTLTIELGSIRDGFTSWQMHQHTVIRDGWGYNYGNYYGGRY